MSYTTAPLGEKRFPARTALYREQGYWGDATLLDCWHMSVLRMPHKKAVIDSHGASFTFAEADEAGARVASWLRGAGVQPGDVVSFQLPGWAEFLPVCVGCLKVGAVLNPIPPNLRLEEVRYILDLCGSRVLLVPYFYKKHFYADMVEALHRDVPGLAATLFVDKFAEGAAGVPESRTLAAVLCESPPLPRAACAALAQDGLSPADQLAAVLFTSGSEGAPKGVMLSHNNIIFSESAFAAHENITQFDTMLMPAPVTHATGFHHGVIMPLLLGATTVLQDVFTAARTLELIEQHQCSVMMASSPFVHDILCELCQEPRNIASLRFFLCGGAPVSPCMMEDALTEFGLHIRNVYGSTESVPHVGVLGEHSAEKKLHTAGVPVPGVEVRVTDRQRQPVPRGEEGEEASRGPQIFLGYLRHPEMTAKAVDEDGWYYSGDLCVMDDEGFVRISGRLKDIIIRGGENISSLEVENVLLRHPNIHEAAVVGMPDARLSERICAYVVLKDADKELTFEEMSEFLRGQNIARQKFPERLELTECLPRTASGKVRKNVLREDIAGKITLANPCGCR